MKKFNFKINNFYSIFNQMHEEGRNRNLDSFLDNELGSSLQTHTSSDFTFELMKRVELEKEFTKQDLKTNKLAKYVTGGFVFSLTALIIMFATLLSTNNGQKDVSFFDNIIERFSGTIETVSILIADNLGFTFSYQTGLIILLVMVFVFIFSIADKVIFKKGYK